ncbi:protein RALF-like 4 [Dorcoceras hygrometricum]|uniref:Protein RALF-like 4 n=1 Tax=Dorcoceras hygrometricum TaxID=472368 RepID=A0A2Z7CX94_9LAMI|nr:protein RALF-like 4 [Dorcoceras hygrometricum]
MKSLLPVVLLIFLSNICSIQNAQHLNASTGSIADFLSHDEEFMMESETTRRLLAGRGSTLGYGTIRPQATIDCQVYGRCIQRAGVPPKPRQCDSANLCDRPGH